MLPFLNHTKYQPWLTRFSLLTLGLGLIGFGWWLSLGSLLAATGVNQQLNYQGKLTNSSGVQVTDGSWNFRFKLYDTSSGGNLIWTERWNSTSTRVTTVNGIFSVALGTITGFATSSVDWNTDNLYLQVDLDADNNGSWEESFSSRKRLTAVPYAFDADEIDGFSATSTAAVANYLMALDSAGNLNLLNQGVSSTRATSSWLYVTNDATIKTLNASTTNIDSLRLFTELRAPLIHASSTDFDSLKVYGSATTTNSLYAASGLWVATTSPWAGYELAVSGDGVLSGNLYTLGNLTVDGYASSTNLYTSGILHVGSTSVLEGSVSGTGFDNSVNTLVDSRISGTWRGQANGLASLDASSKILNSQLSALAISDTFVVASEAEMLALSTAGLGDVAIRTDQDKSYILAAADYTVLANWKELLSPSDAVISINGQRGVVVLSTSDISEGSNLYYTNTRVDSRISGSWRALANGLASLDSSGKVPTSQIPDITINNTYVVADQAARLALSANVGDVAVQTDTSKTYILKELPASTNGNWVELLNSSAVISVNGYTGAVTLTSSDISEGSNQYWTNARFDDRLIATSTWSGTLQITDGGNLGVNINPSYPLEVVGIASTTDKLYVGLNLYVGHASGGDSDTIYFDQGAQSLAWNNTSSRFEFSTNLNIAGKATSSQALWIGDNTSVVNNLNLTDGDLYVQDDIEFDSELFGATARLSVLNASTTNINTLTLFTELRTPTINATSTVFDHVTSTDRIYVGNSLSVATSTPFPGYELTVTGDAALSGNLLVSGGDIGISADTNLIQLAANQVTINGELIATNGRIATLNASTTNINTLTLFTELRTPTINATSTVFDHVTSTDRIYVGNSLSVATSTPWAGMELTVTGDAAISSTLTVGGGTQTATSTTIYGGMLVDDTTLVVNANENRVGIGTASPGDKLTVTNSSSGSRTTGLRVENNFSAANTGISIDFRSAVSDSITGRIANIQDATDAQRHFTFDTLTAGGSLTEKMRITGAGKVGIGDTSPLSLFTVGSGDKFQIDSSGNATSSGWFNIGSTDVIGTLGSLIGNGDLFVGDTATITSNLAIGNGSASDDDYIYFDQANAESLGWNNSLGIFSFSDDVSVSGSLGINTTTPQKSLHVVVSDPLKQYTPNSRGGAIIEVNGDNILRLIGGTNSLTEIWFGDPASETPGRVRYSHAEDSISLYASANPVIRWIGTGATTTGYFSIQSNFTGTLPVNIGSGDLYVGDDATVTDSLHAPTICISNNCRTSWPTSGGTNDWQVIWSGASGQALQPTSTNNLTGLFVTASSTINADLRVTGYINSGGTDINKSIDTYISQGATSDSSNGSAGSNVYLANGGAGGPNGDPANGGAGGTVFMVQGGNYGITGSYGNDGTVIIGNASGNKNATLNLYGTATTTGDLKVLGGDINYGHIGHGYNTTISNGFDQILSINAGAAGNVEIANGGDSAAGGTANGGAAGTITLAVGGAPAGGGGSYGNDGTVTIGNAAGQKNAKLYVYGNATTSGWFNIGTTAIGTTLGSLIGTGDLYVGDDATTTGSLAAVSAVTDTTASAANVFIDTTGLLHKSTSSKRYKTDIDYNGVDGSLVYQLQPASFRDKNSGQEYIGFIAEDVAQIEPRLVLYDPEGNPDALHYGNFSALIVAGLQNLKKEVDELKVGSAQPPVGNDEQPLTVIDNPDLDIQTLAVQQAATFYGTLYVQGEAGFMHKVVFEQDIEVKGKIYASADQAGTAVIKAGATSTAVIFGSEYETAPRVIISPRTNPLTFSWVNNENASGFRINIGEIQNQDLEFNWIALAVKNGNGLSPVIDGLVSSQDRIAAGVPLELWAQVTDPDTKEDDLTYTWNFEPTLSGSLSGERGLIYWTVDNAPEEDTEVTVTLTVTDGGNVVHQTKVITVVSQQPIVDESDNSILQDDPQPTPAPTTAPEILAIFGCTDQTALNYDQTATDDDGSCQYPEEPVAQDDTPTTTPNTQASTQPEPPADTTVSTTQETDGGVGGSML